MDELKCYFGWTLLVLLAILGDVLAGVIQAGINRDIQSQKMKSGLWRKGSEVFLVFFIIIVNIVVDRWGLLAAYEPLKQALELVSVPVMFSYITFKEFASIGENLCRANPDLASLPLFQYLASAQEIADGNKHDEGDER